MKLAIRDTQSRWRWRGEEEGTAEVIEACCPGVDVGDKFWVIRRNQVALYVMLKKRYEGLDADDDAVRVPFMHCPSCGATVEVTLWEPER